MEGNSPNESPITTLPYYPEPGENAYPSMPGEGDGPGGGGSSPWDFLKTISKGVGDYFTGGGDTDWLDLARRGAAAGTALNQWNNSGKYMDMATKYADQMNPFDLAQRKYYQGLLQQSYTDPTTFLQDPGHTATLDKQMNVLQGRLRGSGYMGSGKEGMDLADYQSQSDAQYLQKEREQLAGLAGSNIGPGAAAGLISEGLKGSMQSQSDALGSLMKALEPGMKNQTTINNGIPGGQTNPGGADFSKYLTSGATWARSIASGQPIPWSELARLGKMDLYDPEYQAFIKAQGNAELDVTKGNTTGNWQWDEFGNPNPNYIPGDAGFFPDPADGSFGPQLDSSGIDWGNFFDP